MMPEMSIERIRASVFAEYQPIIDLNNDRMVACEALARWKSSDGSVSSIEPYIDEIEADEEYATALTARMLAYISSELGSILAANPNFSVGVNIPPIVIGRGRIRTLIDDLGLGDRLSQLTGEITERQALDDLGRSAIQLARELGTRIAIDDFGTGESGLQQLIGLEVDTLKIDRSFVVKLGGDEQAERLVRGIAALASVLEVDLVAEGIETLEQADFLRAIGVQKGQGWLWSKAICSADLRSWLT
jgi:sensor c-di-GMP phosphodiesterase-like protein